MRYRLKKGFIKQKIDKETVIFDADTSTLFTLNESAGYVFNKLTKGVDREEIARLMVKRYGISEKRAKKDLNDIISDFEKKKIFEKISSSTSQT